MTVVQASQNHQMIPLCQIHCQTTKAWLRPAASQTNLSGQSLFMEARKEVLGNS